MAERLRIFSIFERRRAHDAGVFWIRRKTGCPRPPRIPRPRGDRGTGAALKEKHNDGWMDDLLKGKTKTRFWRRPRISPRRKQ